MVVSKPCVRRQLGEHLQPLEDPRGVECAPAELAMVVDQYEVGCDQRGYGVPVACRERTLKRGGKLLYMRERCRLARGVARVELGVGRVEVVGLERNQRHAMTMLVGLGDIERLGLARPDVAVGELETLARQGESMAPRGDDLQRGAGRAHLEAEAKR